jgi:hypothetical protein
MRLAETLSPEIAGAQKDHELLVCAILEHRIQQAKAGESCVGRETLRSLVLSVVEQVGRERQALRLALLKNVDQNAIIGQVTAVKQLQMER